MNLVDVVVVLAALAAAWQGARVGAAIQICSIVGFFAGFYVGALMASHTVRWAHSPTARTALALSTMLLVAFSFGLAGRILGGLLTSGSVLRSKLSKSAACPARYFTSAALNPKPLVNRAAL